MGDIGAPAAAQRLWFGCKPLGYCQGRLEMRLNQPQDRMLPLRAPILTKLWPVSASKASVLIRTIRMRRVQHMHGGADDVTGLLIAALTASTHANRPWQRSPAALAMRCSGSGSGANGDAPFACAACSTCTEELMT